MIKFRNMRDLTDNLKVIFDKDQKEALISTVIEFAKDSNEFAPVLTARMIKSVFIASKPLKGLVIWDTPYAQRQFYEHQTKSLWAEKAKARHRKKYLNTIIKKINLKKR